MTQALEISSGGRCRKSFLFDGISSRRNGCDLGERIFIELPRSDRDDIQGQMILIMLEGRSGSVRWITEAGSE